METTATGKVVWLEDRRPKAEMTLTCSFCGTTHVAVVTLGRRYYPCPGCDEVAAEPAKRRR